MGYLLDDLVLLFYDKATCFGNKNTAHFKKQRKPIYIKISSKRNQYI